MRVYGSNGGIGRGDAGEAAGWWATRGAAVAAWAVAGWPVWRWFVARIRDGSDEPWGLVALVAALAFVPWRRLREPVSLGAALAAGGAMATVFIGYDALPALVRGGLWMVALAALLGGTGPALARGGLLLLSLPVVATAQFYLGYPLRALTAVCSVPLLWLGGFDVTRQGTALRWAGETVLVDAPCSGIQMLWTGLFAACALAAVRGFGTGATLRLIRWAGFAVAVANLLRCVALFRIEVSGGAPAGCLHTGVGLVCFGGALGVVTWRAGRMPPGPVRNGREPKPADGDARTLPATAPFSLVRRSRIRTTRKAGDIVASASVPEGSDFAGTAACATSRGFGEGRGRGERRRRWRSPRGGSADRIIPVVGLLLVGVAVRPLLVEARAEPAPEVAAFPGWPETFEGRSLIPLAFSEREARFAAGFPGRIGAFSDGDRTILLRWVPHETRQLHPALHCLRGLGYTVVPGPVWRDGVGRNWGTTLAERDGRRRRVRERISDGAGREWTDVSAWWWDAWRGVSAGPWWAVTVFEE